MSIPTDYAISLLRSLEQSRIENLVTQADARRILQEVRERSENYPNFDSALTEKATHIAYTLISCGCSLIENEDAETDEGLVVLEKGGKILSDVFKFNSDDIETKNYNLLIAGMSLYATKQYSRAFIILHDIDVDFIVGQIIINFIKKDFESMLQIVSNVLFTQAPTHLYLRDFDEWVISHEIARCFLIVADFIQTGNQENFTLIKDILEKLLAISSESALTLYWLIIRLLRIIFSTFQASSLWSILPPFLPERYITEKYIRLLSGFRSPVTEIWPSQTAALPLAVGDNRGAVINLRTSGGKTRVAEIAILRTLSTQLLSKVLYLAPFRSLAFEIEQSLNRTFGPLGITVSQLYGGSTANVTDFELINESQVIIATPEKAKALIRCGSGLEQEIKLIVVDEGHLLGAEERYIKNEMFLTHIKEFASRNQIKMLLLSAVLPNADDLAQWITSDSDLVARSDWKPALERLGLLLWDGKRVRLEWKSEGEPFNPNFIQKGPLGFGLRRNHFPNNKNEAVASTAVRLAQNGTVMIYSARANSINGLAGSVLLALGERPEDFLWDESLWKVFESICFEELGNNDIVLTAARKGVICHNNRLPTLVRIAIERLMRSKAPRIIIASSTLGQGVNVGISTVIVSTPYYSDKVISNRDFWNICGRAGRAFSDVEGKILYVIDTTKAQWQVNNDRRLAQNYFDNRQMEEVRSGLLAALMAICRNASRTGTDFTLLVETIANNFIEGNIREDFSKWLNYIFDFIDDELLAMHEDFSTDDADINWIDDVFRNSLALIQAESENEESYLALLKARTTALLRRIPNRTDRKKLISSGVPLSVSTAMLEDTDFFRNLATTFIQSSVGEHDDIEIIDSIIRELEIWSIQKAHNLMNFVPEQAVLDNIRRSWIRGDALATIMTFEPDAADISKDYYGFTLPWIIHAVSQLFDHETQENVVQLYTSLAMFVELGLPNNLAANIYLAGVRSRSAALEISTIEVFKNKSISEIKQTLLNFSTSDHALSDSSKVWIELLSESTKSQTPKRISFPHFTWKRHNLPDKLYLREVNGECFLTSSDGYFYEKVESTIDLPFSNIANIPGLFFVYENDKWLLRSYNLRIVVNAGD
ncbi:DEAD/DEAH box helicase [Paenibacillus odorifer]|uniref:DEAD/DEAH box helicase n=1 Tax=Paenibacillus TaxID=44249 RepID=UPI0003E29C19|nr:MULTISPECIES: DEAD/DEAH box helicase [Paenibacillus]ETT61795.1 DEAD/DEAH box helicase [Paenibacillus sp. FSL H8-237]OME50682.1 DEAD/DEAH box helicase [Paenibacillus odorifer]